MYSAQKVHQTKAPYRRKEDYTYTIAYKLFRDLAAFLPSLVEKMIHTAIAFMA